MGREGGEGGEGGREGEVREEEDGYLTVVAFLTM